MNLGAKFPNFKAWSNFRLMVVLGSLVTLLSLGLGAVVVQAALSDDQQAGDPATRVEARGSNAPAEPEGEPAPQAAGQAAGRPLQPGTASQAIPLATGESFRVSCPVNRLSTQNTCSVESFRGFDGRVQLECSALPENMRCSFNPGVVTARPNQTTTFGLELVTGRVAPGDYTFNVVGRSGNQVSTYAYPWGLVAPRVATQAQGPPPPPAAPPAPGAPAPPPPPAPAAPAAEANDPTFTFTCGSLSETNKLEWSLSEKGTTARINCFLAPLNGFDEPVNFTFSQPTEVAKPETVNFVLDQLQARKIFDLAFEFSDAVRNLPEAELQAGKDYVVQVTGTSPSGKSLVQQVILTVTE